MSATVTLHQQNGGAINGDIARGGRFTCGHEIDENAKLFTGDVITAPEVMIATVAERVTEVENQRNSPGKWRL